MLTHSMSSSGTPWLLGLISEHIWSEDDFASSLVVLVESHSFVDLMKAESLIDMGLQLSCAHKLTCHRKLLVLLGRQLRQVVRKEEWLHSLILAQEQKRANSTARFLVKCSIQDKSWFKCHEAQHFTHCFASNALKASCWLMLTTNSTHNFFVVSSACIDNILCLVLILEKLNLLSSSYSADGSETLLVRKGNKHAA